MLLYNLVCVAGEADAVAIQHFIQEILAMKSLGKHENIIEIIGSIILSDPVCLVTEFAENGDLLTFLHSQKPTVSLLIKSCPPLVYCLQRRQKHTINCLVMSNTISQNISSQFQLL